MPLILYRLKTVFMRRLLPLRRSETFAKTKCAYVYKNRTATVTQWSKINKHKSDVAVVPIIIIMYRRSSALCETSARPLCAIVTIIPIVQIIIVVSLSPGAYPILRVSHRFLELFGWHNAASV